MNWRGVQRGVGNALSAKMYEERLKPEAPGTEPSFCCKVLTVREPQAAADGDAQLCAAEAREAGEAGLRCAAKGIPHNSNPLNGLLRTTIDARPEPRARC